MQQFKFMLKTQLKFIITIVLVLGLSISLQSLLASWQAPTAGPPGNNIKAPINTGLGFQSKFGSFDVGGDFGVGRDVIIEGKAAVNDIATSSSQLIVKDDTSAGSGIYIEGAGVNPEIALGNGTDDTHWGIYVDKTGSPPSNELRFWKQEGEDVFKLDPNGNLTVAGNVGIGTTNPTAKLQVNSGANIGDEVAKFCDNSGSSCLTMKMVDGIDIYSLPVFPETLLDTCDGSTLNKYICPNDFSGTCIDTYQEGSWKIRDVTCNTPAVSMPIECPCGNCWTTGNLTTCSGPLINTCQSGCVCLAHSCNALCTPLGWVQIGEHYCTSCETGACSN